MSVQGSIASFRARLGTSALPPLATEPLHYSKRHQGQTCRLARDILRIIEVGMALVGTGQMAIGIGRRQYLYGVINCPHPGA